MSSIQEHWAGWVEPFLFNRDTQVPEHRLFGSFKDEPKVHASSEELSKHHAYCQVDDYGDLQVCERYMSKLARFYGVDEEVMLTLQIGACEETGTLKMAGENNASLSSCSHDVGVGEPVALSTPYYSTRIQDLMELKSSTKYVTAPDVEFDIEASKPTWTQLDPNEDANEVASDEDNWSDDDGDGSNREEFNRLKEHPKWGPFFRNNRYSDLKLGALIGQGGQAKVYEAIDGRNSKKGSLVVKVFEKGFRLYKLQKWWPKGLVEAANSHRHVFNVRYVCWALGAQLLEDDRFAFVFPKLNCDLRKRIDDAMRSRNGRGPPFSPFTCFCIISDIAAGMAYLHNRNMMHHDLKAANVLDLRNVSEDQMCIMMLIADFESSAGTWGTGFWRAPEILRQIIERDRAASAGEKRKKLKFTKEADVYSFAMTCYEVITGRLPYEGRSASDVDGIINRGERPELPLGICPGLKDLICRCWHSDPLQRPSFNTIRTDLIEIGKTESKAWNIHVRYKLVLSHLSDSELLDSKTETKGVKNIDWEWPIYDQNRIDGRVQRQLRESGIPYYIIFETENRIIKRLPPGERDNDKPDMTPFEVTFHHTISVVYKGRWDCFFLDHHSRSMLDKVTIKVKSHNLIQVVNQCLPSAQEWFCMENPTIDANDMFIALNAFKDALLTIQQDLDHESKAQYWELKHLLRFLETHYKDTTAHVERMRREKKVSFDLLWAFFFKGERVHYTCNMTGRTLHGIVALAHYKEGQKIKFIVKLDCRDYDGWKYVKRFVKFRVVEFKGEESFDSIGMGPMRFLENPRAAEMDAMFLRNGRKFFYIVAHGSTYMQYVGPRIFKKGRTCKITKQKGDGRVMVDLLSFARTNLDFPLNNAKPPTDRTDHTVPSRNEQETPTDEELMLAPAVVYGFSFSNKQWGGFDINGLSEVHFDDQAFDRDLVLTDPDKKEMLLALVTQYLKDPSADDSMALKIDPISNKGDGCIFLCYGPPGTGKTLTAESIAEKLHRPLWSMSVFELGMEAEDLEEKLTEILDIALQWRAVLLLDEADVYLEKPTSNGNPNRAAMTAIFLRLLEYYRGVLFLTTNRVASLDDAILSRISIFLRYHRISVAQGEAIWRNLLARAQILNPDLSLFSSYSLNGREIRICIRSAQVLVRSSGEELTTDHVLRAVSMLVELRKNLEDAVKEETDEQSITGVLRRVDSIAESTLTSALSAYSIDS
ncbi:hypothetical protein M758_5G119300 [Ceratodon purpureus]|nr:hypothetical protein M758_5G119300 [Ceratodon purpureus]